MVTVACAGCTAQTIGRSEPTVPVTTSTDMTTPTQQQTSSAPGPADVGLEFRLVEAVRGPRAASSPPSAPTPTVDPPVEEIDHPYTWVPSRKWRRALNTFTCPNNRLDELGQRSPDQPLIRCDDEAVAYLMGPVLLSGGVEKATATPPSVGSTQWTVTIDLDAAARVDFAEITTRIAGSGQQLAITDGATVLSAPTNEEPILGGTSVISGGAIGFSEEEATALAERISP